VLDLADSIRQQDDQDFDIVVFLDGGSLEALGDLEERATIIEPPVGSSPASIRQLALTYALERRYDNIVFTDVDDFYTPDRVRRSKRSLGEAGFTFNEIQTVDEAGRLIQKDLIKQFYGNSRIDRIDPLLERNFLGMSNTAVRVSCLREIAIPASLVAVDWYLYSVLLVGGHVGIQAEKALTSYRQSVNNAVGVRSALDEHRLLKGIAIKAMHYESMAAFCAQRRLSSAMEIYKELRSEMERLDARCHNEEFRSQYVEVVNRHYESIYRGWWSEILPLPKWTNYAK
jgi:glycosyltransferase involved in cell wall biosynthesis